MITDHEKRVVAWHEAGHALVSELLPTVDKVQKVSIVPRGKALGYTLNLPQEDRYLKSRQELIDYMKVLLAGRVSEQITFGRVTTGASDDLKRVTAIARSMVYEYGMGTTIRSHQVPGRRLHRLRVAAPDARRGGAGDRRGGLPRRPPPADRPPRPARRDRRAAARERGDRARRDHDDHGSRTAPARPRQRSGIGDDQARRGRPANRPAGRGARQRATASRPNRLGAVFGADRPRRRRGLGPRGCDLALRGELRDAARPPRDGHPSRASRRCCSTSATATSSCSPTRPRHAGRQVHERSRARAFTTSPTASTTSMPRSSSYKSAGSS